MKDEVLGFILFLVTWMIWKTARRKISLERPLVMGILNVTPDSFSDGGETASVDDALRKVERMIADGADIIDIGGESTRPGSRQITPWVEIKRTVPVISAIAGRFDIPLSIDTTKYAVARANLDAGAEIVNDISGLRWDSRIAVAATRSGAGLVLMHSRGTFETMHNEPPVDNIFAEVKQGLTISLEIAKHSGVDDDQIALDVGIGFGKTLHQNLALIAGLDQLVREFSAYPIIAGTSRKSFLGKILDDAPANERLAGSLTTAAIAVWNGARIIRAHDVRETSDTLATVAALMDA